MVSTAIRPEKSASAGSRIIGRIPPERRPDSRGNRERRELNESRLRGALQHVSADFANLVELSES